MKVDHVIIACKLLFFIMSLISIVAILQAPDPSLRMQLFAPMMLLLAVGVALMVMLAVIFASKKAIAENY